MRDAALIEVTRGNRVECVHRGSVVVCDGTGQIVAAWGDPDATVYARSAFKMMQALPLVESGAADAFGLKAHHLALACSSHMAGAYHTEPIGEWLSELGFDDSAYRCGAQTPGDRAAREALIREGASPCQIHNNCSGKHTGFLTLGKHLGSGSEYIDPLHPVQNAVRTALEELTDETSPGFGIDGCSAPNYAFSLHGLARAAAGFATAHQRNDTRAKAQVRLREAMMAHPELVSGHDKPCTELMRLAGGKAAIKGGADGAYIGILPEAGLGIAMKMSDGAERGRDVAMAQLLDRYETLPVGAATERWTRPDVRNWNGLVTGEIRASADFA